MSSYSVPRGKGCGEAGRDEGRRRSRGEPSEGNARARGRWGGGAAEQSLGAEQLPSRGMRRRWKRKRRSCYVRGFFGWDARWGSGRRGAGSGSRRGLGEPCEPAVAPVRHSRNSSVPPRRWTGRAPHRMESDSPAAASRTDSGGDSRRRRAICALRKKRRNPSSASQARGHKG